MGQKPLDVVFRGANFVLSPEYHAKFINLPATCHTPRDQAATSTHTKWFDWQTSLNVGARQLLLLCFLSVENRSKSFIFTVNSQRVPIRVHTPTDTPLKKHGDPSQPHAFHSPSHVAKRLILSIQVSILQRIGKSSIQKEYGYLAIAISFASLVPIDFSHFASILTSFFIAQKARLAQLKILRVQSLFEKISKNTSKTISLLMTIQVTFVWPPFAAITSTIRGGLLSEVALNRASQFGFFSSFSCRVFKRFSSPQKFSIKKTKFSKKCSNWCSFVLRREFLMKIVWSGPQGLRGQP